MSALLDLDAIAERAVAKLGEKIIEALPALIRAELERQQRRPQPLAEILGIKPEAARKREARDPALKLLAVSKHGRRRLYFADDVLAHIGRGSR